MKFLRSVYLVVFIAFLSAVIAFGQSPTTGSISGAVVDPTGAPVVGARVTISDPQNGSSLVVDSDEYGRFYGVQLEPARYSVVVDAAGFAANSASALVEIGLITKLEVRLSIAVVKEEVEVATTAPLVNTTQADFATNVDQDAIDGLPINGRRWSNFALLAPASGLDGNFGLISFRGQSGLLNNSTVDGADNNQAFFGEERGRTRISHVMSQSSIREFQVNTSNFSAEYGRAAGAVVNTVTRSGSNGVHGEAFYFIRDNALGATNSYSLLTAKDQYGNYVSTAVKPQDRRQQFGVAVGGPVKRDRLFYFFTYDQQKRNYPALAAAALPALFDAPSSRELSTVKAVLPSAMRTDANAVAAFNQGLDFLNSLTGEVARTADQLILFPKIDWNLARNHSLAVSYNRMRWDSPGGAESRPVYNRGIASFGGDNVEVDTAVARLTSAMTPTIANELRLMFSRDNEWQLPHTAAANEPKTGPLGRAPQVQVATASYGMSFGTPSTQPRVKYPDEKRLQLADSVSLLRGKHLFKAGADFNRVNDAIDHLYSGGGSYYYSNRANFIADYVQYINAGIAGYTTDTRSYSSYTQAFGPSAWKFTTTDFAWFVQDEWRALPRLTMNFGLRYERELLPAPQAANSLIAETAKFHGDGNNYGPRVGFAYDLSGDGITAIRGGYGMFYARVPNSIVSTALMNTGTQAAQRTYQWRTGNEDAPVFPLVFASAQDPATVASTVAPDVAFFAPDFQNPKIHQADIILEHQLAPGTMLSISYLLSIGRDLPSFIDTNLDPASVVSATDPANPGRPNPANHGYSFTGGPFDGQTLYVPYFTARLDQNFGQMTRITSNVRSRYDGFVVQLRRRMRSGLAYSMSYTFGHAKDDGSTSTNFPTGNNTTYPGAMTYYLGHPVTIARPDYGTSNFDQRQKFVATMFYLPRPFRDANVWTRRVLDQWGFAPVFHASSGRPFTEYISGTPSAVPATCVGCTGLYGAGGVQRLPMLERNSHRMPSTYNLDLRVSKRFYIGEGKWVEFNAEGFNVLNHRNITDVSDAMYYFSGTSGTLMSDDSFGHATAAGNTIFRERQVQFALKLRF